MSDTPAGPGWWLASDGRWYPPVYPPVPPPAPPTAPPAPAGPSTAPAPAPSFPTVPPGPAATPSPVAWPASPAGPTGVAYPAATVLPPAPAPVYAPGPPTVPALPAPGPPGLPPPVGPPVMPADVAGPAALPPTSPPPIGPIRDTTPPPPDGPSGAEAGGTPRWLIPVLAALIVVAIGGDVIGLLNRSGSSGPSTATNVTTTTAPEIGTVYGPGWAHFTAAFPSPPTQITGASLTSGIQGGVQAVGYTVSPVPASTLEQQNAPVPPPPSYVVALVQFKSQAAAELIFHFLSVAKLPPTTVDGMPAYRSVAPASTSSLGAGGGKKVTDSNSTIGAVFFVRGDVLYAAEAVTSHAAAATAFLDSFQPAP